MDEKKSVKNKPKDGIYENKKALKNPFWFQVMVNGERVTRRGFSSRTEAKRARARLIVELNEGSYIEPSKMTFGEYFQDWLKKRKNISDSTRYMYNSYFKNHIDSSIGGIPLSKLTAMDIEFLVEECRDKDLSDEMVKRIFATVNAALNAAEKKDLILKNVANKIEKPKVKRQERPVWSESTVSDFFKASKEESRYWVAAYLAVMTGMRQGEILGLKWADIDFENNVLQVKRNLQKNKGTFDDLKTEKSRRAVAISPQIKTVLEEQKEIIRIEKASMRGNYSDNDLVVCSSKGTPATATKVIEAWNRMQAKFKPEGEPTLTFHDLRHTHASLLLRQGVHPKIVSERLGHSTITLTLDTYSHLLPNMQADAVLEIDKLIKL